MKTEWDYTNLANAYLKRPDYSDDAIDEMLMLAKISKHANVCDIGAGTAHLTMKLAKRELNVTAVEPNDAMREKGIKRTEKWSNVNWHERTGENSGQSDSSFDMVTFGSSFNVTDRQEALKETARILKSKGWFACMWNHRNLDDSIQAEIENIIKSQIKNYDYGTRRKDQSAEIIKSGLFEKVHKIEGNVHRRQSIKDCTEAWRSHATLARQAGDKFSIVTEAIEKYLVGLNTKEIQISYTTRIWVSQLVA